MTSDGLTLEVVDEHGTQRPALVSGEIRVRGPGVITSDFRMCPLPP
jgi:hypothetical protein